MAIDKSFVQQAARLLELTRFLKEAGLKNKDIANALGIFPSAFSAMTSNILHKLVEAEQDGGVNEEQIKALFDTVNNVSEVKTRRRIASYLEKLEQLKLQLFDDLDKQPPNYVDQLIEDSPAEILRLLEGVYHCYYVSSFGYRIKKEPFLIHYDLRKKAYHVRKGNRQSPACYEGFGYMSNNQLFTIQIMEKNTLAVDNFLAHFHLPPLYVETMEMLKGISISMSNSNLPISRKMILHRIGKYHSLDEYDALETHFYQEGEALDNEIVQYLRQECSMIEYLPIPYPDYAPKDLEKEQKVKALME